MDKTKVITKLENVYREKPHRVFSMYLNTDPSDPEQQVGDWKIHLKSGLNNFESYLKAEGDQEEKKSFNRIKEKVQQNEGQRDRYLGPTKTLSIRLKFSSNSNLPLVVL